MNPNQRKPSSQFEINDLIDDAVTNAMARRGFSEDLSDEEAASVAGGVRAITNNCTSVELKPIDLVTTKPSLPIDLVTTKPSLPIDPPVFPFMVVASFDNPDFVSAGVIVISATI
ncbi:hypothetical protein [Microseira sp. BLCC-F43]|jgi:hypothetical protein|uniref:hypothetical protein n=1 Tax=Microseira sp. BLCC-F43 TaxID=3153602 RepID=UPI0035B8BC97